MFTQQDPATNSSWLPVGSFIVKYLLSLSILIVLPLDPHYYQKLAHLDWSTFHYSHIFNIVRYYPSFLTGQEQLVELIFLAGIAVVPAIFWDKIFKNRWSDDTRLYVLQVISRYKLALAVIVYSFLKIFLVQSPAPSITELNTQYGEFSDWKIFSLSLGTAPGYEIFLGLVELLGGLLLLNRRLAWVGALILLFFLGNVFLSNIAYGGAEWVYAGYLIIFALIAMSTDVWRLIKLLVFEQPTAASTYEPHFTDKAQVLRISGKAITIFLIVFYWILTQTGSHANPHHYSNEKGLKGAAGVYDVSEFVLNGDTIPYSKNHPVRWSQVVFEKWNVISVKSNQPLIPFEQTTEVVLPVNPQKLYDLSGVIRRHFYTYQINEQQLVLENKNPNHKSDQFTLNFERPDKQTIRVSGTLSTGDQIEATLQKLDKKYLIIEGRRTPQNL